MRPLPARWSGLRKRLRPLLRPRRMQSALPATLRINFPLAQALRYGENPHQRAALYTDGTGRGIAGATQLQGKELSFNNLVDLDACWELAQEFEEPAVIIVKHTNPCGAATGASVLEAYQKALELPIRFRPLAALSASTAKWTAQRPRRLPSCLSKPLPHRPSVPRPANALRLRRICAWLRCSSAPPRPVVKHVSGGLLLQDADIARVTESELKVVTRRPPTAEELRSLLFAWRVCKHVKSNAIVYARDGQTLGVGAGQMSRVDAARFGAMKAVLPLKECVAASDAFFPFPDGLEAVAQAGATAVIQPGGSVRDEEVIAAADKLGIAMVFTGIRHFRH